MANIPWGTFPPGFCEGIPNMQALNDPHTIDTFYAMKSSGKQALEANNLPLANVWYSAALKIFQLNPRQNIPAQIANEHHIILCNRSLVLYKQGFYQNAEEDALAAIAVSPRYLKGYWRASQSILARSRNNSDLAMPFLAEGLALTLQGQGNEHDKVHFMTEVCKLAVEANMTDKIKSILCSLRVPAPEDSVWLSVLKKLCDQNKWRSMAMLLIHDDSRGVRHSLNNLDVSEWHCGNISVGKLLNTLSDDNMIRWGERLAVCLIEKGASVDTIERYTGTHALHYVVKLSLRIGSVILLRSVLVNYKGNLEKINITENGNTALHIVVKSAKANVEICEDIITLLLNFNCDPSIRDDTNKIPIDYVHSGSKLFSLLKGNSTSGTSSQQLGASLEAFKTEGNKAKQANDYTKALQLYDEALGIAQQSPELYKEAAILYSNKSNVLYQMNKFEDALANAIAAINSGPEYSKGYYRTGKAFLRLGFSKDAFHTLIEGCFKSKDDKDKIDLLTEAATIINTLSSDDFKNCYEMLFNVDSSVWPAVLTQLSKKTQWKSIAYLILGSNLDACTVSGLVTADCIDPFCAGVAGKSSTADLETRTIFKYLEQHDGKVIAHWLDAVMVAVYSHGGEQTLRNLAVGCPLHAVTRFVLQTGRTSLLEVFPRKGPRWSDMNTTGESESVFHLLAKYSPPVPADFLVKVTKSILEKGYRSIMVRDVNNKLPFDLLDITYPMGVFDLFLPDDSREIKMGKLNEKGLSKSQNGNYCEAILLFNKAIDLYRPDAKSDRCLFEVILRNRAKSYIQQKEYQRALKDARESMKFNNNQEAHLIAGRALVGLQKYKQACTELLYAYDYVTTSVQSRAGEILSDLAQLVSQPTIHEYFRYMGNGRHGHVWAQVCHFLVQKGDWKSASEAYYLFEISGKPVIPLKLNLKPFCSIKDIRSNPWVPNMILYLLHCGSDKMTISLEEGDTYLHAAVRIALVSNSPDMLLYLLQRYCQKGDSDQHKLDSRCNTLLHMATKEKKVDKKLRHVVIKNILGCGVDRNVQNNEKKQARWYLSGEQKNKDLIDNMPAKGIQASNYNERRQIGKNSGTNAVGHGRKERTRTCEKCEHLYSNALRKLSADKTGGFKLLIDLLNTDHTNKHHSDIEKKAVDEFVKYMEEISHKDVSICLNSLRKEKYFTIIDRLFSHKRWILLELTIQKYSTLFAVSELKALASNFTVEPLILDTSLASEEDELRIACCLLDSGWQIGDGNGCVAVKNAIELKKYKLVIELIKRGADVSRMSLYNGDTPIHAAISIALKEKQLTFIQELLHMQEEERDKYSYLDPEQVDANGDCIYHLLAKANYNDFVLLLTEMLCSKDISANYYNKKRKYPSDYVKKTHPPLLKFLEDASKIKPSYDQIIYKEIENNAKSKSSNVETEIAPEIKSKHPRQSLTEQTEATRKRIETLILSLPTNVVAKSAADTHTHEIGKNDTDITLTGRKTSVDQTVTKPKVIGMTENKPKRIVTLDDIADKVRFAPKNVEENDLVAISDVPDFENDDMFEPPPLESDEDVNGGTQQIRVQNVLLPANIQNIKKKEDDQDEISDADGELELENSFENLTWEVEYTDKVRKTLEDKQVMSKWKCKIVRIIRMLASGDWQRDLCRKLTNVPPTLRLFEANLSKDRRIIWEKAISFSSRCSDTADRRLKPSAEDGASQVRGGRIYTELIRVWDIVMDHDKIKRSVERIKLSHQRGESCVIRRKLKGLKKENDQRIRAPDITYPMLFTENDSKDDPGRQKQVQHFPPASADETEYHILKFYPWNTTLVKHILHSSNVKVDFPFKVTDLEHAIINLSGKEAILLLGRSGTGKTTCCLYRLWSQFRLYWYNRPIDAPLLPGSERTQVHENNDPCELEDKAEESSETTCEENIGNENNFCEGNIKNENTKHEKKDNCVEDSDTWEHFHQIFVTKNPVLAAEVRKTFNDFLKADDNLSKHQSENIDQALPNRLQDLQENAYPLFLTSRQLLCKLDASVGNPFFEREEDGSMKYHVDGWADTDEDTTDLHFLDYDSADEETGIADGTVNDNDDGIGVNRNTKDDTDVSREVTYDVFENEMWPKLGSKTNADYHPSLVWTEIMSFIKGSYESLTKPNGCLSKDEYIDLGRKRAPNFSGEREEIYDIFVLYEHKKKQGRMFDETDVVRSVFQRLAQLETSPVAIHQIYVDETQDFTQAELFLLIRLCQNPNDMFLTGDTAQSIMRGISFRFKDLRSLFYHVKQMTEETKKTSKASKSVTVHVPNEVHQLTYNYRSHSGILSLASSILDILSHFFPESFDRLDPDQGLFHGPEPILLESCSFSDLAVLLRGNKRKTSNIEFGAHQVILVVNDEARDCLPEELSCGLVLTIYESKGLEFDDVLLYNFFKDSQASSEWRVVTKRLEELASKVTDRSSRQTEMCVRIDQDVLTSKGRPRPLDFDPNQHKILNSELKQLYTALTRARVNVWIFDEDPDKRGPMFEYFKARNLVKPVNVTELNEESLSNTIFVVESSNHDWIQRGDDCMKNRLYGVAANCFRRGGDQNKQVLAQAHDMALTASRKKDKPKEIKDMRAEFLFAAEMYLNCQHLTEAAKCLSNAKEVKLATALYRKLGEYDKAAELCKKNRQFVECSRFYELSEKFNEAVSILYENREYNLAVDVVKRYKMREMEMVKNANPLLDQLRANKPLYTEEKISFRAAEDFHRRSNIKEMHEAVSRFQYEDDKIEFYKGIGYISDAANMLAIAGRFPEATHLHLTSGNLQNAIDMARRSRDDKQIAKCLLDISRVTIENKEEMPSNQAAVEDDLQQALSVFKNCGDKTMSGQVMLLQAQLYNDVKYVLSAGKEFIESRPYPNEAGYVECCIQLTRFMDHNNQEILKFLLKGADCLFNVCKTFVLKGSSSNIGPLSEAKFQSYCQFYGIVQQGHSSLVTFPATKPLCAKMINHNFKLSNHENLVLEAERSINKIVCYLLRESKPWLRFVKRALIDQRVSLQKCRSLHLGKDSTCNDVDTEACNMMHTEHTKTTFKQLIETDLHLVEYEAYCYKADGILKSCKSEHSKGIKNLLSDMKAKEICVHADERYGACRFLWKDFLPESGHPWFLAEDSGQFIKPNTVVLAHMKQYLLNCWNESTYGNRKIECRAVIETEIFLLFEFAYHLFHFETKTGKLRFERTPKQEMITFENALDNELLKDRNPTDFIKQEKKYTLMSSFVETQNKPDRRIFITCVAHRFTDAYEHLIKGDPYAAILSFAKFQTQLSQRKLQDRSIACFYPDIHHYLLWLEFYSTLAFFLIAKSKTQVDTEFTFIVPNNYIALLHFIQATFPKGSQSIYESISRRKKHQKFEDILLDRVKRFAFVISGHAQGAKIPEIISKRCKEDNKDSVLQERLIILNMTMLCNVGKCVPVECETSLFNSVNRTFSSPSIPPRLIKIHDQVKEFKGIRDVAQCLKTFLNSRNMSEQIHAVKWTPDCKEKCTVLELDISLLPSTFLKQTSTARTVETQESVEDIPQDADLTQEEALRTLQEKEELGFTESKTAEKQTTDIDSASHNDYILDFVSIDDSECRACEIGFESYLSTKATGEECETGENQIFKLSKGSDSAVNPMQRQDSQIENDTYKELIIKAKHEHEKDPVHIQNIEHLESFKRNYETHLKPLINRVYDFLQNEKYNLSDEIYVSKHYEHYKDEIQRLKRTHLRIEKVLGEIFQDRKWSEKQEYVNQIAGELQNDLDTISAYVEEQTEKIGIQNRSGAARIEANAAPNGNKDTEENELEKVVLEPVKLTRRYRTGKEKRVLKKLREKNKKQGQT